MNGNGLTRAEVTGAKVGDLIRYTYDTVNGIPHAGARWSDWQEIVEIFARGISVNGFAYVCLYHTYGAHNGRMSHSISEGDLNAELKKGGAHE